MWLHLQSQDFKPHRRHLQKSKQNSKLQLASAVNANAMLILFWYFVVSKSAPDHCRVMRSGGHEIRCVQRNLLLETLAKELPSGTIRYSSKVVSVEESGFYKLIHLADGTILKTKVISSLFILSSLCGSTVMFVTTKRKSSHISYGYIFWTQKRKRMEKIEAWGWFALFMQMLCLVRR